MNVIKIRGYGPSSKLGGLVVQTDKGSIILKKRRVSFLANWSHAKNEIEISRQRGVDSFGHIKFINIFKKVISISSSRGRLLNGILNGIEWTAKVPKDASYLRLTHLDNYAISLSRTAARSGVILDDFSFELERAPRKSSNNGNIFITGISGSSDVYPSRYPELEFENLKIGIKHSNFEEVSFVSSIQNLTYTSEVNTNLKFENLFVTPQGVFFQKSLDDSLTIFDVLPTNYFPSELWVTKLDRALISPTVEDTTTIDNPAIYFHCSSNWAHFIEDNLPSITRILNQYNSRPLYLGGKLTSIQLETIQTVFPNLDIREAKSGHMLFFRDVILNFHQDSRNLQIKGSLSNLPMVDEQSLKTVREKCIAVRDITEISPQKIYISRGNAGFRKLVNSKKVESIFRSHGFQVVEFHKIGFIQRINLLQKCEVLAGETGAGMVNGYFCNTGVTILEIRHPSLIGSTEHLPQVSLLQATYRNLSGSYGNILNKIRYGVDSYSVDVKLLKRLLDNLN